MTVDYYPLVSVGIPTYNRPVGLRRTLECFSNQTYKHLEIIISDNCSQISEVENVIKEFEERDKRICFFRQSKNVGVANNFKFVLEKSTGEYFLWAADDDEWHPDFIKTCIDNIGLSGSIMPKFILRFRLSGIDNVVQLPHLATSESEYNNLHSFISNVQPSLIYGLHKRETILQVLDDNFFDYYDCFFIIRQILNHGFVTLTESIPLYISGIDAKEYEKKPIIPREGRVFSYQKFYSKSLKLLFLSKNLSFRHKYKLMSQLTIFVLNCFVHHETTSRPIQASLIKKIRGIILSLKTDNMKNFLKTIKEKIRFKRIIQLMFNKLGYQIIKRE